MFGPRGLVVAVHLFLSFNLEACVRFIFHPWTIWVSGNRDLLSSPKSWGRAATWPANCFVITFGYFIIYIAVQFKQQKIRSHLFLRNNLHTTKHIHELL